MSIVFIRMDCIRWLWPAKQKSKNFAKVRFALSGAVFFRNPRSQYYAG